MNKRTIITSIVFVSLIAICVIARCLPHAPNFAPVAAAALFAGFFFKRRALAIAVPLLGMFLSDLIVGMHDHLVMLAVYSAILVPLAFRGWLRTKLNALRIGGGAVASAIVFYLVTNFAVWMTSSMYAKTAAELGECYLVAIPFLKNTLASNLMWSAIFFGAYAVCTRLAKSTSAETNSRMPLCQTV